MVAVVGENTNNGAKMLNLSTMFECHFAAGLYDPFRVGSFFGLYCYKYSTPMGSWMHVSKMITVLNKKSCFVNNPLQRPIRASEKIALRKSRGGM
jgi:hypothetical protein